MNIITLFPFDGIEFQDKYIKFNSDWRTVENILGQPEHRYMDFDIFDFEDIVDEEGHYKYDYRIEAPIKKNFFEEHNGIRFVYHNNKLCSIEPDNSYYVRYNDVLLHNKGFEEHKQCKELYTLKEYIKGRKFAVMDLGVIGTRKEGFGFQKIYSKDEFGKTIELMELLGEIMNKESGNNCG